MTKENHSQENLATQLHQSPDQLFEGASITVGRGWNSIVLTAAAEIRALIATNNIKTADPSFPRITTVKEKFGLLRIYYRCSNQELSEALDDIIEKAATASGKTCDECGEPGQMRRGRFLATRCDQHTI